MRICKVYDDDYPWDVRVEKIGRALSGAGHEVFLATRNRARTSTVFEDVDSMHIRRMPPYAWVPAAVDTQLMFPAFFSPRWLSLIRSVVRRNRCELILVRDLPLALAGIMVGRLEGIPVIVDLAENYPDALRSFQRQDGPTLFDRLARNPSMAEWVERVTAKSANHLFVVCEEMKEKLIGVGATANRISLVGNTPSLDSFNANTKPAAGYEDRLVLAYTGEINSYRGVRTPVEAMPRLLEQIPDAHLVIAGDGDSRRELEALAAELGVSDRVDFLGFRPHAELPSLIARADVALIPHLRDEFIDTTLPNKLFDAMAMGTPVAVTDARPLARVVEETGCGVSYRSGDAEDFVRAVAPLVDTELRERMAERGIAAVRDRYHWGKDVETLLGVVERIGRTR